MPTTLITRSASGTGATVKGAPLSSIEIDNNFISLNNHKIEIGSAATQLGYSNVASGLLAVNVQTAIDELASDLASITLPANAITYDNTISELTAVNVKTALDELADAIGDGGGSIAVVNDLSTNSSFFINFSSVSSGTMSTIHTSSTKLSYNPNTGTVSATNFNALSDVKYKKNIVGITSALDTIEQINGIEFDWKDTGKHSSGVIAQELKRVLPWLVDTIHAEGNEDEVTDGVDYYTVNYLGIIAYLIEANKELNRKIENVRAQIPI